MKKRPTEARLSAGLSELVRRLQRVKAEAQRLGVFTDDRELLECSNCGLKEDVDIHGFLFTYFGDSIGKDAGLRFKKEAESLFRCPKCRRKIFAGDVHPSNNSN